MKFVLTLIATLSVIRPTHAAEINSAEAINALFDSGMRHETSFRILGTIVGEVYTEGFVIDDGKGRALLSNRSSTPHRLGDKVIASGVCLITNNVRCRVCAEVSELTVIGRDAVPPPVCATIAEIVSGQCDFRRVRTTGTVLDVVSDDIDTHFQCIVLFDGGKTATISIRQQSPSEPHDFRSLQSAVISVTGVCVPVIGGIRRFHRHGISAWPTDIRIVSSPPVDPFDVRPIDFFPKLEPDEIATSPERRSAVGTVIAVWDGDRVLVNDERTGMVQAILAESSVLPPVGTRIRLAGLPETDLFTVNLSSAIWRAEPGRESVCATPVNVSADALMSDGKNRRRFDASFHCQTIRLSGIVRNVPIGTESKMNLECGRYLLPVNVSACPDALHHVKIGCKAEVTGICLMETENWRPNAPFPRVNGMSVIIRTPSDIRILASPPWWTTGRLLAVIGALLAALAAILIWNTALRRIVERRSRELLREQLAHIETELKVNERTRLSVELHDSLSQNLIGASMEINTAEQLVTDDGILKHLNIASKTLKSSRDELRNCLWDLRSKALEEPDMNAAIRKTLEPYVSDISLMIRFNVPRTLFTDNTAHALMRIIRELVLNAIRHGHARTVKIAGSRENGQLLFSVRDDGCGFDPSAVPGIGQGHFGLQGVRERMRHLKGSVDIESASGAGTYVSARFPLPDDETKRI